MPADEAAAPQFFDHAGFRLAFIDPFPEPAREPVLLIHGFASSHGVNWVAPGWVKLLGDSGYRPIALDNRGHGLSAKSYLPADYAPERMAEDAMALLDFLGVGAAHVMGYSMGARVAAFAALAFPRSVATLVFGGLGMGMVAGVGDWDPIAKALTAEDAASLPAGRPRMFRAFADQTGSDRRALAVCISASRTLLTPERIAQIRQPCLIGVGTRDDLAGAPEELAALMPDASAFSIENRDHMLAVGDRTWKARALAFLGDHPLAA